MNISLMAYYNKLVLSVHALIVLQLFVSYLITKIEIKVLACSFEINLHTNFENPSSNPLQRP
jgi:hypothetical protein